LLPSVASFRRDCYSQSQIIEHALLHAQMAIDAGVSALYAQDTNDTPITTHVLSQSVSLMTAVCRALRDTFPQLMLGVSFMAHGARETLQVAHATDSNFVRLKVYIGTMVKAEGIVQGCAHEAISTRHTLGREDIRIFADIYDRTGEPLAPLPLAEACRQAIDFGRADGLILTGKNDADSINMLQTAQKYRTQAPLLLGGGATTANCAQFGALADAYVTHGAFRRKQPLMQNDLPIEWDADLIRAFVNAAQTAPSQN